MLLQRGQKISLNTDNSLKIMTLLIEWDSSSDIDIDISAFVLNKDKKTENESDFIFYNNSSWNSGAIALFIEDSKKYSKINIDFSKLTEKVENISIVSTIYNYKRRRQNFSKIKEFRIKGIDFYSKKEIFSFIIKDNFSMETGIVLGEIYKYKEQWKFNPVASGYFGGLSDLCNSFGIEAFEETETDEEEFKLDQCNEDLNLAINPDKASLSNDFSNLNEKNPKENISSLTNDSILIKEDIYKESKIIFNLDLLEKENSIFRNAVANLSNMDFNIACSYKLKNGDSGLLQKINGNFGNYFYYPYISLSEDGNIIEINGDKIKEVAKFSLCVYSNYPLDSFTNYQAKITAQFNKDNIITVSLENFKNYPIYNFIEVIVFEDNLLVKKIDNYYSDFKSLQN